MSIVYPTHRPEPRFDWFSDSLAGQLRGDAADVEVVVVDGLYSDERREAFEQIVAGRFHLRHVQAKPTPWNGEFRLSWNEYLATSSARNTGLVYATAPYVAYEDDCSVLAPDWWREVRTAARNGAVITGTCHDHWDVVVEAGVLVSSRAAPESADTRWKLGSDTRPVAVGGSNLRAASFAAPRDLLVEINGFDELWDPVGDDGYQLGHRLEWSGADVLFSRRMASVRSLARARHDVVRRLVKHSDAPRYLTRLATFGVTHRSFGGPTDSWHMLLDVLFGRRERQAIGNYYELGHLATESFHETVERFPLRDWFDDQPLTEM